MSSDQVTKADADLWLAYGLKLKSTFMQGSLGPDDRFYLAPLSAAGIAAGKRIDQNITNYGIYNVADSLLSLSSPVFLPTRESYSKRAQQYSGQVYLNADGNQGAAVRYKNAQDDYIQATQYLTDQKNRALADWKSDVSYGITTDNFVTWAAMNAPGYSAAQNSQNAASAALNAASAFIQGPNAAALGKIQNNLQAALGASNIPGFTMNVSAASADQVGASGTGTPLAPFINPFYSIESSYSANVDNWIATFAQNKKNPTNFSFSASDASSSDWSNLGFSQSSVEVTGSYAIFFSATYRENNQTVTKHITAEEAGSDFQVTLTTTGFGSYKVQPGKWNPAGLFEMPLVDDADKSLRDPSAYVTTAFLAYGVGLSISLNSNAASQVHDYLSKASSSGGSASIFGFNIGLGGSVETSNTSTVTYDDVKNASSGTTINIPASDNAYPTLLAVVGTSLPTPPK